VTYRLSRCLLLTLVLGATFAFAETLTGKVVGVSDGDTLTVLDAERHLHKVRLAGIDAPEKGQAFGQQAKKFLSSIVFGNVVDVQYKKTDRYGRLVGKVRIGERDMGLELVQAGLAWHYKAYVKEQSMADRNAYADAEIAAREQHVGLWFDKQPVAPWAWRQQRKSCRSSDDCPP